MLAVGLWLEKNVVGETNNRSLKMAIDGRKGGPISIKIIKGETPYQLTFTEWGYWFHNQALLMLFVILLPTERSPDRPCHHHSICDFHHEPRGDKGGDEKCQASCSRPSIPQQYTYNSGYQVKKS